MDDGDDVASAIWFEQPMDRLRHPLHHIGEALAAGRPLMRRGMPEAMERAGARLAQFLVGQPLPLAEALLGEIGDRRRGGPGIGSGPGKPARTIACAVS